MPLRTKLSITTLQILVSGTVISHCKLIHFHFDYDLGSHVLLFLVTERAGHVGILITMGFIFVNL